jgi:3-hydroxymyristoyl/3-hydroxydecanoyl-(acyl carrier protein) dehydratase
VLVLRDMEERERRLVYFTGIDEARFRRTVVPGDQLKLTLEVVNLRARAARMRGTATVDGQVAAEAIIISAMVDRP